MPGFDFFQTDIQKNKDWNTIKGNFRGNYCICFQTDIQKNKDWISSNSLIHWDRKSVV